MRRRAKPAKAKVEAKLPVARKSPKNEGARVHDLEKRLAEALDQQTAASEILRVISSSPTDVQPVFDAIVLNASRLCGGEYAIVIRYDGEMMHLAAQHNPRPGAAEPVAHLFPRAPTRGSSPGRAILTQSLVHIPDALEDPEYDLDIVRAAGLRGVLSMPMFRDGKSIGAISVSRETPGTFAQSQIELLQTFADQAVIAIENVRLFNELQEKNRALTESHAQVTEALEQQTATSEILRVISSSPTDVQPVFDAIVESAVRLCDAGYGAVFTFDGDLVHLVAHHNFSETWLEGVRNQYPMRPSRAHISGRAILSGSVVQIPDVALDHEYGSPLAVQRGFRSLLAVPILRSGAPIGSIVIYRPESGPFPDSEIELLKTFADQAVIAIENFRLFTELQNTNHALIAAHAQVTEALEQQTATSEILRVISSSPTDVQPVFDSIAASALRLCDAKLCTTFTFDGDLIHLVASHHVTEEGAAAYRDAYPSRPGRASGTHRAILTRTIVHIPDIREDPEYELRALARANDYGCVLAVPMLRDGHPVGAITVGREAARPFPSEQIELLRTFADQAVIAIENVRLFKELEEKNQALTAAHAQVTEALEQQTATSDILRLISSSPTDLRPVFRGVAETAAQLLQADNAQIFRVEGSALRVAASHGTLRAFASDDLPPISRGLVTGRAIIDRRTIHVHDLLAEVATEYPEARELQRRASHRTTLVTPMLRKGVSIGAIAILRREVRPFTDNEIRLLETFADQAVIAIENVRLFTELQTSNSELTTALETQTATSDILRVISRSPTDVQPVFDAVAESAARLCDAFDVTIFRRDGDRLRLVAHHGPMPVGTMGDFSLSVSRETVGGRSVIDAVTLNLEDVQADAGEFPEGVGHARRFGHRAMLSVPLTRDGAAIGVIQLRRTEPGRFTDRQVALLQTFADQAVIAIENVRLFTELQASNRELTTAHAQVTEALEQQTATSEVLKVISRSTFNLQPVLQTLIENATRLCGAQQGFIFRPDGDLYHLAVDYNAPPAFREWVQSYGIRAGDGAVVGRVALENRAIQILDAQADTDWRARNAEAPGTSGVRTLLGVPMRREGALIGVIAMWRTDVQPFTDKQVELIETFADQAVIAIENVRLFTELEARTAALTRSVDQLTALGEVGRAVSSTLDLETVLTTIVSRAVQLSGVDGGVVFEYDNGTEEFVHRAATETGGPLAEARRATRVRKGEGVVGRTAITLEPVQVPDITGPGAYVGANRENLIASGVRAILAVPMVRDGQLIGCLVVSRNRAGNFPAETVELLRTFATQSALAIQNARLFHEIADKSRQLEAASQHKSEFLANMSHELRTPLNAIIGFSEVLAQGMFGAINDKQTEYLHDILESGRHLLSLINDILDLSKIEAGRMDLELSEFDLPEAIQNALTLVRERALRRGIALHHVIDARVADIRADERKIKQVLLNLLSNAIKFTPEGGRIEVRVAPAEGLVEVSVTDTGIGIAPEDLEAVFEEFRQVGTADKKAEGTGLGLTLSRKFIELHGGQIRVTSQVGVGSRFTFTLPLRVD